MNKFNKGKSIGIVAASLAAVSLMGVGFATWIIGTRTTDTNNDISIVADEVQYKSLKVSVDFTNIIKLAETGTPTNSSDYFSYKGNNDGNLKVSAKFTFTFGKDFTADDYDFTKIHFSIEDATTGFVDNKVTTDGVALTERPYSDTLTYFDAPGDLEFTKSKLGTLPKAEGNNLTVTKTITEDIDFSWGSMFGNKSPLTYYNAEIANASDKDTFSEHAYTELNAMKTKYKTGSKIKLKIELQKEKE